MTSVAFPDPSAQPSKKRCTQCGVEQDCAAFRPAKRYRHGLNSECRNCERVRRQAYMSGKDEPATKACSLCGLLKPFTGFSLMLRTGSARQACCKACVALYKQRHYRANYTEERRKRDAWYQEHREDVLRQQHERSLARQPGVDERKRQRAMEAERTRPERQARRKANEKVRRAQRRASALCVQCGKPVGDSHARCAPCRSANLANTKRTRQARSAAGECRECGAPALPALRTSTWARCERCYLMSTARRRLGDACLWGALRAILVAQQYRCAYTAEALVLGVNDSVDHIHPVSRFPQLAGDVDNIEWVTRSVNAMKHDRTREEFLSYLATIVGVCGAHRASHMLAETVRQPTASS